MVDEGIFWIVICNILCIAFGGMIGYEEGYKKGKGIARDYVKRLERQLNYYRDKNQNQ